MKKPFKLYEMLLGLLIIPGMWLVVKNIDISMQIGVWVGLISAFLAALFATLNKKLIFNTDSMTITFLELGSAFLFISMILPFYFYQNEQAV